MIHNDTPQPPCSDKIFWCDLCEFKCSSKGDWNKHIARPKHITRTQLAQNDTIPSPKTPPTYICNCGNTYKHHSGLSRHKKICNSGAQEVTNEKDELIKQLIKENKELKFLFLEIVKNIKTI